MDWPNTDDEGKILQDAWDYKGRPALRYTTGGWASAAMILGVEMCERLTTLGIAVNLVTYLTGTMHLGNATSANSVTNFLGISFMLSLLGGFLADTFLGRYRTIAIFTSVQAIGVIILTISTIVPSLRPPKCKAGSSDCVPANDNQLTALYSALYITALGTGGLKSSVSGFGSDQFDDSNKNERILMTNFFNWFFFFISIGSLAAVTVLVYIQDNQGRNWGYGICACSILIGLIIFLSGSRMYRYKKLEGSPLTQFAAIFVAAWRKRKLETPSDTNWLFDISDIVIKGPEKTKKMKVKQRLPHSKEFRFLDKAAIKETETSTPGGIVNKWRLATLTDVEEVKLVIRMLPTWATTILFWTIYAQMTTFSVSQAATMNRHIGKSFKIPAASMSMFFVISILLTVPVYDHVIVPLFKKIRKTRNGLTPLERMGIGLTMSVLAMASAAIVEIKRLNVARSHGLTDDINAVVPISVFWLVPQFFFVGSGEAFTYTGQLDFFLRECPKGMKTMSTGLFLSTIALGCFFSSLLVTIVGKITGDKHPWLADNLNQGRLDNFYWLLAILSILNLGLYLWGAKGYEYKEKRLADEGIESEGEDGPSCH